MLRALQRLPRVCVIGQRPFSYLPLDDQAAALQRRLNSIYRSAPESDWQTLDLVQQGVDLVVSSTVPQCRLPRAEKMAAEIHHALDQHTQVISVVLHRDALKRELTDILARYEQD